MVVRADKRTAVLVTIALLCASFGALPSAGAAEVASAGVTGGALRSVTFVSANTGFAAADSGAILKTTDGGDTWIQVRAADSYSFVGIDFWDASKGVAVDYTGKVASTGDGGSNWTNIDFTPYTDMDGTSGFSHGDVVCLPGTTTALAAAGDPAPGDSTNIGGTTLRTTGVLEYWRNPLTPTTPHWVYNAGAEEWQRDGWGEFLDLDYVGTDTVWASGIDYWAAWNGYNTEKYPLMQSADGGVTYTPVAGFGTTHLRLEGVAFGSASAGITVGQVVAGDRVVYYTTDGGATWTASGSTAGTAALSAVDMTDATHGWAVSSDGSIVRTTDGGATWTACTITGGNAYALYDVEFRPGTTTGWAVGASGTVLLTTDGVTWRQPTGTVSNTAPVLTAIGSKSVAELSQLAFTTTATDADLPAQTLTYSLTGTPPTGAAITSGGAFTWTPSEAQGPGSYSVTVRVADGQGGTDSETFTVTVSEVADPPPPVLAPVYRFYNVTNGTHFFTPDATERDMVLARWPKIYQFEGTAYSLNPANNSQPLYRFYNRVSGSHFYTASDAEAAMVLAKWPNVFTLDGRTYAVNPTPVPNSIPVYRFYNLKNGSHFFTASAEERDMVIARWPTVYSFEGPAFWLGQ